MPFAPALALQVSASPEIEEAAALEGVTAGEWVKARVRAGVNRTTVRSEVSEQEILNGVKVKYYD